LLEKVKKLFDGMPILPTMAIQH